VNIIVFHEHLNELCKYYESKAHFDELMLLLEQGLNLDRVHQGIYTQLGICYSKYKEEKVMEHIKLFWQRVNIPALLTACRQNLLWSEAVFLYKNYDQFDNAIDVMIDHPSAWDHKLFKEILLSVPNTDAYYKAVDYYVQEHPLILNDLLMEMSGKLDHTRVVNQIRKWGHLPLIEKYLLHVQKDNLGQVNEAVNELLLMEEKYKQLRDSIDTYDRFDQIALAQKIENHQLLEFRRISAYLYKLNKRWERSIDLSKLDSLWQDAMETAQQSQEQTMAENLLTFFVSKGLSECFGAMLFTCYELIRPDVVLELAWRNGLMDYAMPFMIQSFRQFTEKVSFLTTKIEEHEKVRESDRKEQQQAQQDHGPSTLSVQVPQYLALTAAPTGFQQNIQPQFNTFGPLGS